MFWTVFLAALLALYIIGCVTILGMLVLLHTEEGIKKGQWTTAILAVFLSWFTVGVLIAADPDEPLNEHF